MELVTPDIKYKDTFIAALKDGFCFGSQPPLSAEEIAKKVKLSQNTIYNYIRDGLVRVPEGRRIGKRMNKI